MPHLQSVIRDRNGSATAREDVDHRVRPPDPVRDEAVPVSAIDVAEAIIRAHHEEWSRVVASLTRRFGDLDIAEESAAEAFATAVARWPA